MSGKFIHNEKLSSNPNYYYLCRAILLAQLFWRNKVAAKFMCLNEKETL